MCLIQIASKNHEEKLHTLRREEDEYKKIFNDMKKEITK